MLASISRSATHQSGGRDPGSRQARRERGHSRVVRGAGIAGDEGEVRVMEAAAEVRTGRTRCIGAARHE